MNDFDSPFSCPMCGCEEVRWAAPILSLMSSEVKVACSCRACGWVYLIEQEVECVGDE